MHCSAMASCPALLPDPPSHRGTSASADMDLAAPADGVGGGSARVFGMRGACRRAEPGAEGDVVGGRLRPPRHALSPGRPRMARGGCRRTTTSRRLRSRRRHRCEGGGCLEGGRCWRLLPRRWAGPAAGARGVCRLGKGGGSEQAGRPRVDGCGRRWHRRKEPRRGRGPGALRPLPPGVTLLLMLVPCAYRRMICDGCWLPGPGHLGLHPLVFGSQRSVPAAESAAR